MTMDYQGNSKKEKEDVPAKNVEKVVVGTVIVQKKSLGRKFKDIFVEADFKTVVKYVISDVLIPAARNMIVDASTKGIERMMYGERAIHRSSFGSGPRITYNNPINRASYRPGPPQRLAPSIEQGARRSSQHDRGSFILSSREEAEQVLERMNDIIDTYEVASVADLNELVGFSSSHVDNKWGWIFLGDVPVRQVREGFLIDLPDPEPIK